MAATIYVLSNDGKKLMPSTRQRHFRHLVKDGKAEVVSHHPYTVRLLYETTKETQPMELCMDSGAEHIGVSVKSESKEYESIQFDLLKDEKQRHDDSRKYRRTRRNHKRYRAPRFSNRKRHNDEDKKWLAPSVEHKADIHIMIVERYCVAAPIQNVYIEGGRFDIQVLAAIQEGKPIPQGVDYQRGEQYGHDTLREAVFFRDNYTCKFCGRNSVKDGAILHAHHAYFWRGQHGDRLVELATCCEKCHTSANHQPGGKLWGYDKKLPSYVGAAFMNSVKWYIYEALKKRLPCDVYLTYGAATKRSRINLGLEKSHTNDAYAMGQFHPSARAEERTLKKRRRNNRVLELFYDARILDTRTSKKVSGKDLGCERTNRCESRTSDKSLRKYRGEEVSKGRRSIRRQRYPIQPGDLLNVDGKKVHAKGVHCNGARVIIQETGKSVAITKVKILRHVNGWMAA